MKLTVCIPHRWSAWGFALDYLPYVQRECLNCGKSQTRAKTSADVQPEDPTRFIVEALHPPTNWRDYLHPGEPCALKFPDHEDSRA